MNLRGNYKLLISQESVVKFLALKFFVILCLLTIQCSSNIEKSKDNNAKPTIDNSLLTGEFQDEEALLDEEQLSKQRKNVESTIKELSKNYNLTSLKEKRLSDDEIEMRIWGDVGLNYEKIFVLNSHNGRSEAFLVEPQIVDDNLEKTQQSKIATKKTSFFAPKSGWKELYNYLQIDQLRFPLPYSPDNKNTLPIVDEGIVFLEIKQNKNYDSIFFRQFTESEDGRIVLGICKKMESEFNITIGCGN